MLAYLKVDPEINMTCFLQHRTCVLHGGSQDGLRAPREAPVGVRDSFVTCPTNTQAASPQESPSSWGGGEQMPMTNKQRGSHLGEKGPGALWDERWGLHTAACSKHIH